MLASAAASAQAAHQVEPASACTLTPQYPLPQGTSELQSLLLRLDQAAPQCLLDAGFHAWRGAVLLSLGRPAAAVESLERALLIDPGLPGAQLDYAQALYAVGDKLASRELLQRLAERPDLPAQIQALLQQELKATDPAAWRTRWVLTTALGYDNNLNNAPAASELTLTFPQGAVTLPLLESFRPHAGGSWLNMVQWQGLKPQGSQLWLLQAELRARHTSQPDTRYQQADMSASWLQAPEAPRQWIARVGASRIDFGGQHLFQGVRANALHQWQARWSPLAGSGGNCRPGLGAETELRRYPASAELNGRYVGLVVSASCQAQTVAAASAGQLLSVQLRWGREHPHDAARPGGIYTKLELRAAWEGRLGGYRINADYAYARQTDAAGYSPLLSANLARETGRHTVRLEAARPLPKGLAGDVDWFVSAEASRQTSNLAAFASRQNALYTGLRWTLQ
ncbi:MAG: tetratricopeptide repeat protein [Ramlibacter sp.]